MRSKRVKSFRLAIWNKTQQEFKDWSEKNNDM